MKTPCYNDQYMSRNLYIVRHGQTEWNVERRRQGRTDIELNETGIRQASIVKQKLADISFDICYASPLKRAAKTAKIICEDKVPIIYDELLVERCFGETEGVVQGDMPWASDFTFGKKYDNGIEPWEDVLARAKVFLEKLRDVNAKNILIVSHGVFLKALHYTIVGYDENTDFLGWHLENCEVEKYTLS